MDTEQPAPAPDPAPTASVTEPWSPDRHPDGRRAFRTVRWLVGGYLGLSVATLAVAAALHGDARAVNAAVWIRGTVVVASALLTRRFAVRAAQGSQRAYLRLRIVTGVMTVAIAAILALPGTFPLWMKIEQAACGLLLVGVVLVVNGRRVRALFGHRRS